MLFRAIAVIKSSLNGIAFVTLQLTFIFLPLLPDILKVYVPLSFTLNIFSVLLLSSFNIAPSNASIEALDGAILKEDKSSTEKIFKVNDNGTYTFRISGSNGRKIKVSCKVTNAIPLRDDLITAIARNNNRKFKWRNKENKSKRQNK